MVKIDRMLHTLSPEIISADRTRNAFGESMNKVYHDVTLCGRELSPIVQMQMKVIPSHFAVLFHVSLPLIHFL